MFKKTKINQMEIRNKFIRSATWDGLANEDGSCNKEITDWMTNLAKGQIGLIIGGAAYINKTGKIGIKQLGIDNDNLIDNYKKMVEKVHQKGCNIVLQIHHGGGRSLLEKSTPLGPSTLNIANFSSREMTENEIDQTIEDFTSAAIRAKAAGFDGIQLHGAHCYLLSQFLSPFFNKRKDHYGGNLDNRVRIILKIVKRIRSELGKQFPIMIKLNSEDFIDDGFTISEMIKTSTLLEKAGIDAIELSGGSLLSISKHSSVRKQKTNFEKENVYFLDAAILYKEKIKVPLILVGGIRSFKTAKELVEKYKVDYISLCRPLIREPDLIKRWQSGDISKAKCISCNKCFTPLKTGKGLYCVLDREYKKIY